MDQDMVAMRKNRASTSGELAENGRKESRSGLLIHSRYPSLLSESVIDFTEPPNFSRPQPTCISRKQSGRWRDRVSAAPSSTFDSKPSTSVKRTSGAPKRRVSSSTLTLG